MQHFDEKKYQKTLQLTFEANKDVKFQHISLIRCIASKSSGKYVGCVHCHDNSGEEVCVNINNSAAETMLYYPGKNSTEFVGRLTGLHFSYTGGCFLGGGRTRLWFYAKFR